MWSTSSDTWCNFNLTVSWPMTEDFDRVVDNHADCGNLLRGCLIPIINTTFIEISTTAYLFLFFPSSYPKTLPLESLDQERLKLNLLQSPSAMIRKIKLPLRTTTHLPTPQMVVVLYSDTSIPGSGYSRFRRTEKRLGMCALNQCFPDE